MSKKNTTSTSQSKSISQRLKEYNKNLYDFLSKEVINWYYLEHKCLTMNQMIKFKTVSKDIDNILTLMVAYRFVEKLQGITLNKTKPFAQITPKIIDAKPNTNGYDIVYNTDEIKIVAEVKCNLPCKQKEYGSGQIEGIVKDIIGLINIQKKEKSQIKNKMDFDNAYKFLVVLEDEFNNTKEALQKLKGTINRGDSTSNMIPDLKKELQNKRIDEILVDYNDKLDDKDKIYVVYIKPDDDLISELLDEKNHGCNISAQL